MGMLCILLDHAENVRKCLAVSFCVCFPSVNITKFNVPTFYYNLQIINFHAHASLIVIPGKGLIIVSSPSDPLSVPP